MGMVIIPFSAEARSGHTGTKPLTGGGWDWYVLGCRYRAGRARSPGEVQPGLGQVGRDGHRWLKHFIVSGSLPVTLWAKSSVSTGAVVSCPTEVLPKA